MKSLETTLALWDMLEEDAELFFPIVKDETKKAFWMEPSSNMDRFLVRVFMTQIEAQTYTAQKKETSTKLLSAKLASATTTNLLSFLDASGAAIIDKKVDCVLSVLDMEGKMHSMETIWSNTKQNL